MQQTISESELFRLQSLLIFEKKLKAEGFQRIAGVDEAGRGPLAGPVVAAACILPDGILFPNLNDSKQLTAAAREQLFAQITACPDLLFGIGIVDVETIDRINILQATFLAMQKAVAALNCTPDYLLIDGNQLPHFPYPMQGIVEGDALSLSIAAASVIAKVTRDRILEEYDLQWPQYGFKRHKGYATELHRQAILKWGPCPIHRRSFGSLKNFAINALGR
ncbi:MAG: ribonuclease HII [Chlamydiota bacterium]